MERTHTLVEINGETVKIERPAKSANVVTDYCEITNRHEECSIMPGVLSANGQRYGQLTDFELLEVFQDVIITKNIDYKCAMEMRLNLDKDGNIVGKTRPKVVCRDGVNMVINVENCDKDFRRKIRTLAKMVDGAKTKAKVKSDKAVILAGYVEAGKPSFEDEDIVISDGAIKFMEKFFKS